MAEPTSEKPSHPLKGKKILFADFAVVKYASITQWFRRDGIETDAVTEAERFKGRIAQEWFDACVLNLLLGGVGPFELIKTVRSTSKNPDMKIIVSSRQVQRLNIQNTMRAGANDFVADPVDPENLYNRILYHLAPKRVINAESYEKTAASREAQPYLNLLLETSESLSKLEIGKENKGLYKVLAGIAQLTQSNRTSLIIVDEETSSGLILASSDDEKFNDFQISLNKYPEVLHVMHSDVFVLIDDVSKNALTQSISNSVQSISIGSIMVFPVRFGADVVGVVTIRRPKAHELPSMDILRVIQALANTMAPIASLRVRLRRLYKEFAAKRAEKVASQEALMGSGEVPAETPPQQTGTLAPETSASASSETPSADPAKTDVKAA